MKEKLTMSVDEKQVLDSLRKIDAYLPSLGVLVGIAQRRGIPFVLRGVADHLEEKEFAI